MVVSSYIWLVSGIIIRRLSSKNMTLDDQSNSNIWKVYLASEKEGIVICHDNQVPVSKYPVNTKNWLYNFKDFDVV